MRYLRRWSKYRDEFPARAKCDACGGYGHKSPVPRYGLRDDDDDPGDCYQCDGTGLRKLNGPIVCKGKRL